MAILDYRVMYLMAFGLFLFFFLKLKLSPNCPTLLIIHETPVFPPLCCTEGCACRTLSVAIWFTVNSFPSPPSITSPQFICFFFRTGPRGARNTVTTSWLVFLKAELSDMVKDIHCFFTLKKSWRCAAEVNWSVIQSIHPLAYPFQNSQWKWLHLCVESAVEDRFLQTFIWWLPRVQIILACMIERCLWIDPCRMLVQRWDFESTGACQGVSGGRASWCTCSLEWRLWAMLLLTAWPETPFCCHFTQLTSSLWGRTGKVHA